MKQSYQIHLQINNFDSDKGLYVFNWMGDKLEHTLEELDLLIDAEDEADAASIVFKQSENTLKIIEIFTPEQGVPERVNSTIKESNRYMKQYIELCVPLRASDVLSIASNSPASVGNN